MKHKEDFFVSPPLADEVTSGKSTLYPGSLNVSCMCRCTLVGTAVSLLSGTKHEDQDVSLNETSNTSNHRYAALRPDPVKDDDDDGGAAE